MAGAPNIVMVMTDQNRADFSKRSGFALDTTPFLDALAAAGAWFPTAYTSAPACVPARTSLLTGRFPSAHRVTQNSNEHAAIFAEDLLGVLKDRGYRTVFSGKPHMYAQPADFDSYAGPYFHEGGPERTRADAEFDAWLRGLDHGVSHSPTPFPLEQQLPYRIVDDAIRAVDQEQDASRPVFLWVSFPEPHNPYQAPEPYFGMFDEAEIPQRSSGPEAAAAKGGQWSWLRDLIEQKRPGYDDEWRRYRANYCGQLRLIDDQVRRLMHELDRALAGETLFVFLSDHGDYAGDYGLQRKGVGMPECLMRIPLIFHWPGRVLPARHEEYASIVDILPTLCEIVGGEIPPGVHGRSLAPLLRGEAAPEGIFSTAYAERGFGGAEYGADERPTLHFPYEGRTFDELNTVTQSGRSAMLRRGRHKLIAHSSGRLELYDLASDPAELDNLAGLAEVAQIEAAMLAGLLQWTLRVQDDLPPGRYTAKTLEHNWVPTGNVEKE